MVPFNVAEAVELPKQKKKEMNTLNTEEITRFLKAIQESRHHTAFLLELSTGLRRGELLGLTWKDIDLKNSTIRVRQQLLRCKDGLSFHDPKTEKSKRSIAINSEITEALKKHKIAQNEN